MPEPIRAELERYHQLIDALALLAQNSHEVDAVVQAVHEQAQKLFPAQITLLALQQPDGDWLWEIYEGQQRHTQSLPFYPEGIVERVLHGEALSVPHIYTYLKEHSLRARRILQDNTVILDIEPEDERELLYQPVPSMLYVPLEVQGERVGVLSVQSYEAGAFDETDLQFLQLLAQHVSIALENAALREELKQLTRTDALTGLLNRRAFDHDAFIALTTAQHEERPLNLAILDIHRFKQINDEFGHQAGDAVLATVGQILTQALPAPHAAFRLGGDEFALLVWGTSARLSELTMRLTHALRVASWPPGVGPICLHSGWAQWPEEGLNEWLSLADTRMYQAKRRRIEGRQVDWGLDFGENSPEELSQ